MGILDLFREKKAEPPPVCPKCGDAAWQYGKTRVWYRVSSSSSTTKTTTDRSARNMTESLFGTGERKTSYSTTTITDYDGFEIEEGTCPKCGHTVFEVEIYKWQRNGGISITDYLRSKPKDSRWFNEIPDAPRITDLVYVQWTEDDYADSCWYPHIITGFSDDGVINTKNFGKGYSTIRQSHIRYFADVAKNLPAYSYHTRKAEQALDAQGWDYGNFDRIKFGAPVIKDIPKKKGYYIKQIVFSVIGGAVLGLLSGLLLQWIPFIGPLAALAGTIAGILFVFNQYVPEDTSPYYKGYQKHKRTQNILLIVLLVIMAGPQLNESFRLLVKDFTPKPVVTAPVVATGTKATVTSDVINLRDEPSSSADYVKDLKTGDIITITGPSIDVGGNNWWVPAEHEGVSGYFPMQFLKINE
ncbi:hypothetical protein AGMMS49928_09270 [Spirochaetia bacterium]|nr:hypothetical protein AGMMS49928_09270 [Spirochaetia bacterium]